MSNNKTQINLVETIAKLYSEIKQAKSEGNKYRILEIIPGELNEKPIVVVQTINKNIACRLDVMEIVQDDELLHRFSKKDIRTLTYLACNYQSRPKVEIDSVSFSTKLNRLIFSIFKGSKKQKQELHASDLLSNEEFINSMSPNDAKKIGYTAASEQLQQIKEEIKRQTKP